MQGLITAIRTLTIIPVPGKDSPNMGTALEWFPLVGALLGSLVVGVAKGIMHISGASWPEGAAIGVIAVSMVMTRGIHLDGLADWSDSFGAMGDKCKALKIMKDSHVGSFGVLAVVLTVLMRYSAVHRLAVEGSMLWVFVAFVVSRTMLVDMAVRLPYARTDGGKAASFIRDANRFHWVVALSLGLALCVVVAGFAGTVVFLGGWFFSLLFGFGVRRRFGGVTGDIMGALHELEETLILVFCALFAEHISIVSPLKSLFLIVWKMA